MINVYPNYEEPLRVAIEALSTFVLTPEKAAELLDTIVDLQKHEYKLEYDRRIERRKRNERLSKNDNAG